MVGLTAKDIKAIFKKLYELDKLGDKLLDQYESLGVCIDGKTEEVFCGCFSVFSYICDLTGNNNDELKDDFMYMKFDPFWERWGETLTNGRALDKD